jgi:hypothetical protein
LMKFRRSIGWVHLVCCKDTISAEKFKDGDWWGLIVINGKRNYVKHKERGLRNLFLSD